MYVITAHQRHGQTDRRTDRRTDVKRSHDRYIAKACSGKKSTENCEIQKDRQNPYLHAISTPRGFAPNSAPPGALLYPWTPRPTSSYRV